MTDWIPPNRPLIGDQQQSYFNKPSSSSSSSPMEDEEENDELRQLQLEIDRLEEEEKAKKSKKKKKAATTDLVPAAVPDGDGSIDWLQTRRRVMGEGMNATIPSASRHEALFEVEVKHHTLLRKDEIALVMDALGGEDIQVIYDNPLERRMGGAMGMILVTAPRSSQMRVMADTLVRQLRHRKLQEVNVLGAMQGPEGEEDSNWMVVDCRNFVVHILEEKTRAALNLEGLWNGKDPLHQVSFQDEDAVENYIAAHPVPDNYGAHSLLNWDDRFRQLQKNRWLAPHKPVVKSQRQKRKRR